MTASPTTAPRRKISIPNQKRWTRAEYERFVEMGAFTPDDRLELLEGIIVEKMPQKVPHSSGIRRMEKALNCIFTDGYDVRAQLPLALGEDSELEPDIAVVSGDIADYDTAQPTTALLVAEISDSTLRTDRLIKSRIYARAGIAEYVILNLLDRNLEVRRNPTAISSSPLGFDYADVAILTDAQTWTPLAAPTAAIAVADLLP